MTRQQFPSSPTGRADIATDADVVLIGGGIISATLGAMLARLYPELRVVLLERAHILASESSGPWNNAGTGHSGFCELNYMPDPTDGRKAVAIAEQFATTRAWWGELIDEGVLDASFLQRAPHLTVVFGHRDVAYLRTRYETLRQHRLFSPMQFTDDPEVIAQWAPAVMAGRDPGEPMAATRHPDGTDIDFGALTVGLTRVLTAAGGEIRFGHDVRRLRRDGAGDWMISGRSPHGAFRLRARRVFVGAGGRALELLQRAHVRSVRGYGVLPVGAAFLRCAEPQAVRALDAKVYGQADIGAPPMSVPHLDRRSVEGTTYLMFGPYATFSTRLLKDGSLADFFRTLRPATVPVVAAAALQNLPLVRYLLTELFARPSARFAQLRRFYPRARPEQWEFIAAGQRAQLVTPDRRRIGVLQQGTELVVDGGGTIAGLLGASPGASTAVPIMMDLLRQWFPGAEPITSAGRW